MTTIAYKDEILAYDSRLTKGDTILDDNFDKSVSIKDNNFFYTGSPYDLDHLINGFLNKTRVLEDDHQINSEAIVIDSDSNIWNCSFDEENAFWRFKLDPKKILAIGSGMAYALTAMDCGKSAVEAVKYAAKRDIFTGGSIRSYNIYTFLSYKTGDKD